MANAQVDDSTTSLIINYLPQSLTDDQFIELFESIGPMQNARVMRNKVSLSCKVPNRTGFAKSLHKKDSDKEMLEK